MSKAHQTIALMTAHKAPARPVEAPEKPRSSYGSVPGAEFPAAVYASVLTAFAWILVASWLAFGGEAEANLTLVIAGLLAIVFFALPVLMSRAAATRSVERRSTTLDEFLGSRLETATGSLAGSEAWLQILVIPVTLALAAVAIGAVYAFAA